MSRSNGDGLPLKAALKATKERKRRAQRAAAAGTEGAIRSAPSESSGAVAPEALQNEGAEQGHPHDEREEEGDGNPTGGDGGVAGGTA